MVTENFGFRVRTYRRSNSAYGDASIISVRKFVQNSLLETCLLNISALKKTFAFQDHCCSERYLIRRISASSPCHKDMLLSLKQTAVEARRGQRTMHCCFWTGNGYRLRRRSLFRETGAFCPNI